MLKFTEDHEWVRFESETATVGITAYAADKLGELVFVELPEVGRQVKKGDAVVVVESCKAASEVYAPIDGLVIAVNGTVSDSPGTVNSEPLDAGWLIKIKASDPAQLNDLLDQDAYAALVE